MGWAVAVAILGAGCAASRPGPSGVMSEGRYEDRERRFTFEVPSEWGAEGSRNPFSKPGHLARFRSANENATVTAHALKIGKGGCIGTAKRWLGSALAAGTRGVESRDVELDNGKLPAAKGELTFEGSGREGVFSLICGKTTVIVLEGSIAGGATRAEKQELEDMVGSLAFLARAGAPVRPAAKSDAVAYFRHKVTWRGQTLQTIARWYTGVAENWKLLADPVNPDLTQCCANLRVGREVEIPKQLLIREDPPSPAQRRPPPPRKASRPAAESPPSDRDEEPIAPLEDLPSTITEEPLPPDDSSPLDLEREEEAPAMEPPDAEEEAEELPDVIPPS